MKNDEITMMKGLQMEVSNNLKTIETLKKENKKLMEKLHSIDERKVENRITVEEQLNYYNIAGGVGLLIVILGLVFS